MKQHRRPEWLVEAQDKLGRLDPLDDQRFQLIRERVSVPRLRRGHFFGDEVGDSKRRVSKAAVKFFLEWVKERAARVKLDDAEQRGEVLKHHAAAEQFWKALLERANAE